VAPLNHIVQDIATIKIFQHKEEAAYMFSFRRYLFVDGRNLKKEPSPVIQSFSNDGCEETR
jgi:hypothetical protein